MKLHFQGKPEEKFCSLSPKLELVASNLEIYRNQINPRVEDPGFKARLSREGIKERIYCAIAVRDRRLENQSMLISFFCLLVQERAWDSPCVFLSRDKKAREKPFFSQRDFVTQNR